MFSTETFDGLQNFQFPEVAISDKIIEQLKDLEHPRNKVLGKRMESFFKIAMDHSERYTVIGSNIQIISEKITLGEIDFLLWDHQINKPLHVELIYKFYLYDPGFDSEVQKWLGPNRNDSLAKKLNKLKSKQLPLLFRKESRDVIKKFNIDMEQIQQQICFKAQLFLPPDIESNSEFINPDALFGNYSNLQKFKELSRNFETLALPGKTGWSLNPEKNNSWEKPSEVLIKIEKQLQEKRAPLIWIKNHDQFKSAFITWW
nr:DUF1853 family protein [Gramella sp. AN32]